MVNSLAADRFVFVLGRKRQIIDKPSQFESETHVEESTYMDVPVAYPVYTTYRIIVDGKPYASIRSFPHKKGAHRPIKILKRKSDGMLEIHFVKKYTTIH